MTIQPEIGMPVLYWSRGATRAQAATITRVLVSQLEGEPAVVHLGLHEGYQREARFVPVRPGSGNENEVGGNTQEFCEFAPWFIRLMVAVTAPAFTWTPAPIALFDSDELVRCQHGASFGIAIGRNAERPDCQPTSQVLG
jgi:hypothetical protein